MCSREQVASHLPFYFLIMQLFVSTLNNDNKNTHFFQTLILMCEMIYLVVINCCTTIINGFIRIYQECEKKFKREETEEGRVSTQTQFEYAYSLVHSVYSADIKKVCSIFHTSLNFIHVCCLAAFNPVLNNF